MERRGDLPAIPLGSYWFFMTGVPYEQCANEFGWTVNGPWRSCITVCGRSFPRTGTAAC